MREQNPVWTRRLQCVECQRVSRDGERGWRAYLTAEEEPDDPGEVVVLCEECSRREFSD